MPCDYIIVVNTTKFIKRAVAQMLQKLTQLYYFQIHMISLSFITIIEVLSYSLLVLLTSRDLNTHDMLELRAQPPRNARRRHSREARHHAYRDYLFSAIRRY